MAPGSLLPIPDSNQELSPPQQAQARLFLPDLARVIKRQVLTGFSFRLISAKAAAMRRTAQYLKR